MSSMDKDESIYLQHMVETAREVEDFARGVTRDEFDANRGLQIILSHLLQIIGEAARLVSPALRSRIPIPWPIITGMRHRIVHEYFRVDLKVVYSTATQDMRPLIEAVEPVLNEILRALTAAPADGAAPAGTVKPTAEGNA